MTPCVVSQPESLVPLCVDLDGALVKTDLLWESFIRLLRHNPLDCFLIPLWWLRGRARLKAQIAARVHLDIGALPYHQPLVEFLRAERAHGRPVLLVTASDSVLAQSVAAYLGVFTEVLASDGKTNLRDETKAARLVERFGEGGFDYVGNSSVDLPVWEKARRAIIVNCSSRLAAKVHRRATVSFVFKGPGSRLNALLRALRPHQWVKNLIVFVPLVTSHKLVQLPLVLDAFLGFVAVSLCASGVYVLNDLFDLDSDRHHPGKQLRPFASGDLPLWAGLAAFPPLLVASALLAWSLSWSFAATLGVYFAVTVAYSCGLKQLPLLDVFCLAGLYTIRLIAGHEATGIICTYWLLVFSMFIFLNLALVKRFVELEAARGQRRIEIKGRGYSPGDAEAVATLGPSSGYLSVLVLALYVNSQEVRVLYRHPTLLLVICPLLLYWVSRIWLLAHRGQIDDDPVTFALRDRASYLVAALALAIIWLATGH